MSTVNLGRIKSAGMRQKSIKIVCVWDGTYGIYGLYRIYGIYGIYGI